MSMPSAFASLDRAIIQPSLLFPKKAKRPHIFNVLCFSNLRDALINDAPRLKYVMESDDCEGQPFRPEQRKPVEDEIAKHR